MQGFNGEVTAAGLAWFLENFISPVVNQAKDVLIKQKWEMFDWRKAEQSYRENLIHLYNSMRVLGKSEPVVLDDIYIDVYILNELTARRRFNIEELRKRSDDSFQITGRTNGLALVKTGKNLLILGKPGAGKTTFLKYITIQASKYRVVNRIPVFLSLNEWANSGFDSLLPFLVKQFEICRFPDAEQFVKYILESGNAIVLFDGLDEVRQENEQRGSLIRLLQNFARQYDKVQCLITSRIAATDYAFEGFSDVEIADFTDEQIEKYANKWFATERKKYESFMTELYMFENQGLHELCNIPLLLSILCLAYDEDMELSPRRAELYETALDALLRKWDSSREIKRDVIYRNLSTRRKQQMLMHIAAPMFEEGEYFFTQLQLERRIIDYISGLPDSSTVEDIDATSILKAIESQHSLLIERAQGIYSFSHLSFQEYFTAKYVATNEADGAIKRLIKTHLTDTRWREVFLMTITLLDKATNMVALMNHCIHELVIQDDRLSNFLMLADKYAKQNTKKELQYSYRLAFLGITDTSVRIDAVRLANETDKLLDRAIRVACMLDVLQRSVWKSDKGFDLDLVRSLELDLDSQLMRDVVNSLLSDHGDGLAIDFCLLFAYQWASILSSILSRQLVKSYTSSYHRYFVYIKEIIEKTNDLSLLATISNLSLPNKKSRQFEWKRLTSDLRRVLQEKRSIHLDFQISTQQLALLSTYLYANTLLVQCLNLAYGVDRQSILHDLLALPN